MHLPINFFGLVSIVVVAAEAEAEAAATLSPVEAELGATCVLGVATLVAGSAS